MKCISFNLSKRVKKVTKNQSNKKLNTFLKHLMYHNFISFLVKEYDLKYSRENIGIAICVIPMFDK